MLTEKVKGLDVTSRLIESGLFDLPSRRGKGKGKRGVCYSCQAICYRKERHRQLIEHFSYRI
jgi:hypothetical protein